MMETAMLAAKCGNVRAILGWQEGSTLRSALAVALAATGSPWPAFVPMHDPLRDAYWGVAATCQGSFAFLETDSVHISQLPPQLLRVSPFISHLVADTPFQHTCTGPRCPFGLMPHRH